MIRKFSTRKMRRMLYINTPDAVWQTFDPLDDTAPAKIKVWQSWFEDQMRHKHGDKFRGVLAIQSDIFSTDKVRVQLVAKLWEDR